MCDYYFLIQLRHCVIEIYDYNFIISSLWHKHYMKDKKQ